MNKNRLEAFSDGVLAIIITIMVLEIKIPHSSNIQDLLQIFPTFISYLISFIYVGIYWNNHHHLIHTLHKVTGPVMWANLHLLFWLSLIPFASGWIGENHYKPYPTMLYGVMLLMAAVAYFILQGIIIKVEGKSSKLKQAVGNDWKGKVSVVCYFFAVCTSLKWPWIAQIIYVIVAIMWLLPDRRIEKFMQSQ
ncbi:TMEM175 family protein [Neobacillus niacini]|uniref:TMEM175 family protein n=1 Tax=Neobacillus niacini TaxID=86668 RepID=UPI0005EE75D7|nr:TMEM175 family protein [Neobacillus niacini]